MSKYLQWKEEKQAIVFIFSRETWVFLFWFLPATLFAVLSVQTTRERPYLHNLAFSGGRKRPRTWNGRDLSSSEGTRRHFYIEMRKFFFKPLNLNVRAVHSYYRESRWFFKCFATKLVSQKREKVKVAMMRCATLESWSVWFWDLCPVTNVQLSLYKTCFCELHFPAMRA